MTKNQLTVPEISDERDQLIQQVLDDPRELSPAVQVRFAKRIGRPGNSRVMMMDAQTSGPMSEEDEESESKLALRLADGTNVQLSLSFFNDNQPALAGVGAGGGGGGRRTNFAPFNTYIYEPRTYSVNERESTKLPAIMVGMAFMLGATSYGVLVLTGQMHDQLGLIPKNQVAKAPVASAPTKQAPAKALAKAPAVVHAAAKIANEPIPPAPSVSAPETAPTKIYSKRAFAKTARSHEQVLVSHSSHAPRGEFFVPPPPPMTFNSPPPGKGLGFVPPPPPTPYMVPTGVPAAFDPLAALAPAVAHSGRTYAPKKTIEPVSFTSTIETKPMEIKRPIEQIAPSAVEKPVVQQYGDANQLQEQQPISAPLR